MRLTLHEAEREKTNDVHGSGDVYAYCVGGMPPGENANIALFDGSWRILRWNDEWHGNWTGDYASPADALTGLQEEISLATVRSA
jgi:hypothetical protein